MANKILFWDVDTQQKINANGAQNSSPVRLAYKEAPDWTINFMQDGSAIDVSDITSWSAAIDTDYLHEDITGALTGAKTGAITSINADGISTTPTDSGIIELDNGTNSEDVAYTAVSLVSGSEYRFTVDTTLTYSYSENDEVAIENTTPMVRVSDSEIDSTSAASGIIIPTIDSNTTRFKDVIGASASINAYFELYGNKTGNMKHKVRFRIICDNTLDPSGGTNTVGSSQYSASEIDSLIADNLTFEKQTATTTDTLTLTKNYTQVFATNAITITLPASPGASTKLVEIVNMDSDTKTIDPGSNNLNGDTTDMTMSMQYSVTKLYWDGSEWINPINVTK